MTIKFTIREIECLVKINETKSFIEAASELGLSQPTLSSHISNLENKLNIKLLHRSRAGVSLTSAGKKVYSKSRDILNSCSSIMSSINDLQKLKTGTLKIDASTIPGTYILPAYIKSFNSKFPSISIKMLIKDSEEVIADIINKNIDIGFIGCTPPNDIYSMPIFSDEIVIASPIEHHWSSKDSISLKEFLKEPVIMREPGSGTRRSFLEVLRKKTHTTLNTHSIMGSSEAVKRSILEGIAPGVISSEAIINELQCGKLTKVKIRGLNLKRQFYLITENYRKTSASCREFIKLFR